MKCHFYYTYVVASSWLARARVSQQRGRAAWQTLKHGTSKEAIFPLTPQGIDTYCLLKVCQIMQNLIHLSL